MDAIDSSGEVGEAFCEVHGETVGWVATEHAVEEVDGKVNIRCDEEEVVDQAEEKGLGGVQEVQDFALELCVEVIT